MEELVYLRWVNACLRYELKGIRTGRAPATGPGTGFTALDLGNMMSPRSSMMARKLMDAYAMEDERDRRALEEQLAKAKAAAAEKGSETAKKRGVMGRLFGKRGKDADDDDESNKAGKTGKDTSPTAEQRKAAASALHGMSFMSMMERASERGGAIGALSPPRAGASFTGGGGSGSLGRVLERSNSGVVGHANASKTNKDPTANVGAHFKNKAARAKPAGQRALSLHVRCAIRRVAPGCCGATHRA